MEVEAMSKTGTWTWLVYMAGDNNLQGAGSTDLTEMKRVGSTDDVNVLVQFDTKANKTTRYRIEKNKLKVLEQMPGVDCGDPKVLTSFIRWGIKNFPAKHYLLDVWNHGGGWENLPADYDYDAIRAAKPQAAAKLRRLKRSLFRTTVKRIHARSPQARAIAIDCGSGDYLDNQELRTAVARALPAGRKLDIFACDACLMNMLEIAYEMQDTARFMVGSEETEPADGWPYAAILRPLVARPAMAPPELAKLIVQEYRKSFQHTGDATTQSALDLARIPAAAAAVNALADLLLADLPQLAGTVILARDRAQKFEMPEYIDLGDFARQLAQRLPQHAKLQTTVRDIHAALDPAAPGTLVIQNATTGTKMARATGVSIYFPRAEDYAPDYGALRFSQQGRWRTFLEAVFQA
jgi:hypothetical protein